MKFVFIFGAALIAVSACAKEDITSLHEKTPPVVLEESSIEQAIKASMAKSKLQDSQEFVASQRENISEQDMETAYEMCLNAMSEYYKAVWNGSPIELERFIDNETLKQYTQKKIQSLHNVYGQMDPVQTIEVNGWEGEYRDDGDGGFLYLKLPVQINKMIGGYGEVTEFLVRNANGKLVIVDWYTGAKDSYDFIVRGENLKIDDPAIWNDKEWVRKLDNRTE
ncbi:hypothetical protein [Sporosarcina sp. Te-1]|uniref:hypothetical protein n=1 Tax=Sporosarcina sp. Te-1 TaxID=2818390 RepID=UPI001A9EB859|nr:hypothetical protein [Sporosarcina sp. Te-1]QTD41824.1 hypothetical protein J3U78_02935 [Sporosarcina sp. Te-1]